ncbi:MAG: flippase-like domain-containing protein [Candidatus Hydrogenedentes bacterium]|nr:flippase-like domain-containing protein [Candidatus Hydrogenedentota bacterium]
MKKRRLQIFLGLMLGAALLWWLFRETEWSKVFAAFLDCDWRWLIAAEFFIFLTFFARVQRWSYIVRAVKPVSWRALFSATQIGFLANFTLPGRVGEFIRAVVLARLAALPISQGLAFVALDRVTDLFGLIAMMLVAAAAFQPAGDIVLPAELNAPVIPADAIRTTTVLTLVAMLAIILAFVLLYLNQRLALRLNDAIVGSVSRKLAARTHQMLEHFADGMHVFRSWSDMGLSIFFSLLTWLIGAGHFTCVLFAFGMAPPWYAPFVVMALLAIAISLPSTPGFVGLYQLGIIGAVLLTMPQADLDVAKAAAILAHLINLLTVVVVGLFCLYREGFHLGELRGKGSGES